MLLEIFYHGTVYFYKWNPLPAQIRVASNYIAIKYESRLLLALAIRKDSTPIAESTMADGTLIEPPGISRLTNRSL